MRNNILTILLLLIVFFIVIRPVTANPDVLRYKNDVNLFYRETCPHCHEEIKFLKDIEQIYPDLIINYFEVSEEENDRLYTAFADYYNSSTSGVPRTFIGDNVFIGFDPNDSTPSYSMTYKAYIGYKNHIASAINSLANHQDIKIQEDKTKLNHFLIFLIILIYISSYFVFKKRMINEQYRRYWISGLVATCLLAFFIFITFLPESLITTFASKLPFPLFVVVVSIADGFNPCAFTVLFILLSLLTYTKRKRDMNLIGTIFIITSAVMYFLFIMLMILVGSIFIQNYGETILKLLGVAVLSAGLVNVKDYIFFKKGVSLSLSDKDKEKITKKASKIVRSLNDANKKSIWYAISATVILAIGVNLVELGCTAILPTVYMSSLLTKFGTKLGIVHLFWTAIYSLIYVIPLFAILFNFIFTFKSKRVSENQGRILKLAAGIFMIIFGIIMIIKPNLLMIG